MICRTCIHSQVGSYFPPKKQQQKLSWVVDCNKSRTARKLLAFFALCVSQVVQIVLIGHGYCSDRRRCGCDLSCVTWPITNDNGGWIRLIAMSVILHAIKCTNLPGFAPPVLEGTSIETVIDPGVHTNKRSAVDARRHMQFCTYMVACGIPSWSPPFLPFSLNVSFTIGKSILLPTECQIISIGIAQQIKYLQQSQVKVPTTYPVQPSPSKSMTRGFPSDTRPELYPWWFPSSGHEWWTLLCSLFLLALSVSDESTTKSEESCESCVCMELSHRKHKLTLPFWIVSMIFSVTTLDPMCVSLKGSWSLMSLQNLHAIY